MILLLSFFFHYHSKYLVLEEVNTGFNLNCILSATRIQNKNIADNLCRLRKLTRMLFLHISLPTVCSTTAKGEIELNYEYVSHQPPKLKPLTLTGREMLKDISAGHVDHLALVHVEPAPHLIPLRLTAWDEKHGKPLNSTPKVKDKMLIVSPTQLLTYSCVCVWVWGGGHMHLAPLPYRQISSRPGPGSNQLIFLPINSIIPSLTSNCRDQECQSKRENRSKIKPMVWH